MYAMEPASVQDSIDDGVMQDEYDYHHDLCNYFPMIERPYVHLMLNWAFKNFEVGVWTSASQDYADDVVEKLMIDPQHGEPLFVYAIDRCVHKVVSAGPWSMGGHIEYIKDLKKVKKYGYARENILVVDDTPSKWQRDYGNLIRIPPFEGERSDLYMKKLMSYLDTLKDLDNVRTIDKRGWWKKIDK